MREIKPWVGVYNRWETAVKEIINMACIKRQKYGYCSHHQCQYPDEAQGYECVDIINGKYCEAGLKCLPKCQYSYDITNPETMYDLIFTVFEID